MIRIFAVALAITGLHLPVLAQQSSDVRMPMDGAAYLQDSRGGIVRSGTGLCWRTGYWETKSALAGCDGVLAPPVANPIAPPITPATPQPDKVQTAARPAARCDFAVTLTHDETFEINRSSLNQAAQRRLDEVADDVKNKCALLEVVEVTGHADKLGPATSNQKLSEERAQAVARFLINKGISAGAILPRGAGEHQPLQSCEGKRSRDDLHRCLATNRRVTIEVRGLEFQR
ncbi:MAG TPA: OmpA family protein [Noviherbaspirillum sp.]